MRVIVLPFGFIIKFDSVDDLQTHVSNLAGMIEWSEEELKAHRPVKLAYAIYEDPDKSEEIKEILAGLPPIEEFEEKPEEE